MRMFIALFLAILAAPAFGQANVRSAEPPPSIVDEQPIPVPVPPPPLVNSSSPAGPATNAANTPIQRAGAAMPPGTSSPATPEMKYRAAYYEHLDRMNHITEGKFVWQDRASEVTLWLVVFIVVSGVGLSFFQIWIAFHQGGTVGDTSIEASAQNFRVTSSVVGIIVLLISTGFLYLFLQRVYDIKVVDMRAPSQQRSELAKPKSAADYGLPPPDAMPDTAAPSPTPAGSTSAKTDN